jgi:hypothetical protein
MYMLGFPIGYIIIYIYIYKYVHAYAWEWGWEAGDGRVRVGGGLGGVREGRLVVGAGKRSSRWPFKGWGEES